jgi:ribonuclease HII
MVFVLGTDEAGYGPNLGPLCIAASAWKLADDAPVDSLYERLAAVVCSQVLKTNTKLPIADSKALYKSGGTLEPLERGVLVALACLDRRPECWREIWTALDGAAVPQIDDLPWHDDFNEPLPLQTTSDTVAAGATLLTSGCQDAAVSLMELQATILFPAAFNRSVQQCDNKAEVLSLATLNLARRVLESLSPGRAVVCCDKHGGRTYYAGVLQHIFPDELVIARTETAALAVYDVKHEGRSIEFRFQPKGEQHLPTALAPMTAKYLRELSMRPFNAFWQRYIPNLKPTAGYPTDARRFFDDISHIRQRLTISNDLIWRCR